MSKKIEKLTPAQEKLMEEVRDEWIAHGLSTAEADQPSAEQAIAQAYSAAGYTMPSELAWFASPLGAAIGAALVEERGLRELASISAAVNDDVSGVLDSLSNDQRQRVRNHVNNFIFGQHDAHWLAFYDFFGRIGLAEEVAPLQGLISYGRSAGWALPFEECVLLCDRTSAVNLDDDNNVHSDDGPAIAFRDDWRIYSVHGVRVPEQVIEAPETLNPREQISKEQNAEVRRVMIEKYGASQYLLGIGAECVQRDDFGELYKATVPEDEDLVMVKVYNSTPEADGSFKEYWLRVPPTIESAHAAVAWSFDKEDGEYEPNAES